MIQRRSRPLLKALIPSAEYSVGVSPYDSAVGRGGGVAFAQQQDRRRDAVLAQLDTLVHQCHGEPPGTAGQRGPGHGRAHRGRSRAP